MQWDVEQYGIYDWSATGCYETTYERGDDVWFVQPYNEETVWLIADHYPVSVLPYHGLAMVRLGTREFP